MDCSHNDVSIWDAIGTGCLACVQKNVASGQLKIKDASGLTPLCVTASMPLSPDNEAVFRYLVAHADAQSLTEKVLGMSPLEIAVSNSIEWVKIILDYHYNSILNSSDLNILHMAAYKDNKALMQFLYEKFPELLNREQYGSTPLDVAINSNCVNVAEFLLCRGATYHKDMVQISSENMRQMLASY